jgi:hypothetical protein
MAERDIDAAELAREIARRTVFSTGGGGPNQETILAAEMIGHASALCRQERCREAAALFEFAARRRPGDAEARNNLGFCLIPENPAAALAHLEAAEQMGYCHGVVNAYNRVCCQLGLKRPRAALAAADAYWKTRDDRPGRALLWAWDGDRSWHITDVADPYLALAKLAAEIASTEGWLEAEQRWVSRSETDNHP